MKKGLGRFEKKGFSVVEIIVASAIILLLVTAATGAWHLYFNLSNTSTQITQAALLTDEAAEALNFYRDKGWTSYISPLLLNTPYYIYWNGSAYATSTSPVLVNSNYYVQFQLSAINRDGSSDITTSGGTLDSRSKNVLITVFGSATTTSSAILAQTSIILHDVFHN